MPVVPYLVDNTTLATALAFGPTAAGATSATQIIHVWFNKGTPGGSISNFSIQAVDPSSGLDTGIDWLDQTWLLARINGGTNPSNDPTFVSVTTDWYPLGDGHLLPCPNLPGNCALYLELKLHPPMRDGAPTEAVNFGLNWNYNESSLSLSGALSDLGQGIVPGVGDRTVTEWVEAPTVLATPTTPDAYAHVSKRWWVGAGVSLRTYATDDLLFNQNDGAVAALTTGHEYQALISQPPSAGAADVASVVTKGLLATTGTSVLPALPAGNILIATVLVAYHASASVINQSNITVFAVDGRGKPSIGTGLHVNVAALRAVLPGARIINRAARAVAVTGNASPITSYIWLGSGDVFTVVASSATPPFAGALPICKCVANATTVTSVTDLRTFFEPTARILTLHFPHQEPRYFGHLRSQRKDYAIANAAYTDCSGPAREMILMSVTALWKTQPTGSTTADIGVSGTTQRYAAAVSTVATSVSMGLIAGPLYYSSPVIRITPNAVSGTNGVVELTFWYFDLRPSSTDEIDTIGAPFSWNLDRMVASMTGGAGTGTGATTFDVKRLSDFSSLCAAGAMPSIAAPASYPTDNATGYPSITVGSPDTFGLLLAAVCDPGLSGYNNYDIQCALTLYPLVVPA